jgi:hypothetical protein
MTKLKLAGISLIIIQFLSVSACKKDSDSSSNTPTITTQFGIFKVANDNKTVSMDGEINSNTLANFNSLIAAYPNIEQINIVNCGGSSDDDINLQVSLLVHQKGIKTHINNAGLIASGGVDFFLAGTKRTKGSNTQIGVHSWGGEDDNGNTVKATDFPRGHQHHLPYINYYKSIGFSQQEAEDFYYFTINAAGPDDIHWMTDAEISQYKILKN